MATCVCLCMDHVQVQVDADATKRIQHLAELRSTVFREKLEALGFGKFRDNIFE